MTDLMVLLRRISGAAAAACGRAVERLQRRHHRHGDVADTAEGLQAPTQACEDDGVQEVWMGEQDDPGFSIHMGVTSSFAEGIFYYGKVGGLPLRVLSDDPAAFERRIEMTLAIKGEVPADEFAPRMDALCLSDGRAVQAWSVRSTDGKGDRILAFVEGEVLGRIVGDASALAADVAEYDRIKGLMHKAEALKAQGA